MKAIMKLLILVILSSVLMMPVNGYYMYAEKDSDSVRVEYNLSETKQLFQDAYNIADQAIYYANQNGIKVTNGRDWIAYDVRQSILSYLYQESLKHGGNELALAMYGWIGEVIGAIGYEELLEEIEDAKIQLYYKPMKLEMNEKNILYDLHIGPNCRWEYINGSYREICYI